MSKVDLIYAGVAGAAVGGIAAPLIFPMAAAVKTASLVTSIACSGALAYAHQSGLIDRVRQEDAEVRESRREVRRQKQISWELRETKRCEVEDLKEILLMLDDLSPFEQRHFLKELDLLELMPVYQESRMLKMAEAEPTQTIETTASPVQEVSPFDGGWLEWAVDSVISQALGPSQPVTPIVDDAFEEVDLGKAIAEMMVGGDVPLCVMLACPPRTGKTTLMTVTLAWLHKLTSGGAKVKIYNGKENIDPVTGELKDKFLGLVNDPTRYQAIETNEEGKEFAEEFADVAGRMKQPRQYPEVLILDEYNNIRARVAGYDQLNGIPKNKGYLNQVDVNAGLLITQGTSRRQFLLITSHSAYVKNIGIDRSYQDGLYSIVLGRGGALDGIYKALKGSTAVVQNTVRANQLLLELQQWEQSPTRDHSKVVALTNLIDGNFGLYFAKYVDLAKVHFSPVQQPKPEPAEDPYAIWDDVYEDGEGHQPEEDPDWEKTKPQPQSTSQTPKDNPIVNADSRESLSIAVVNSQKQLVDALHGWIVQLKRMPTDAEFSQQVQRLLGLQIHPSEAVLRGVKSLLSKHHGHKFD